MSTYIEFTIGPDKIIKNKSSFWECRNLGILKIMTRSFEKLQELGCLNQDYVIRINTGDTPTQDKKTDIKNFIEFNTTTYDRNQSSLFPDYIFGNWWHIGLTNFDNFTKEIQKNSSVENIKSDNLFWTGALQGINQRIKYIELCNQNSDKFIGNPMGWDNQGNPTKFVKIKDHCDFKYLIDLSGLGWSGRLKLLPFCHRPLFIAERKCVSWSDIAIINQNKHISIKEDLSDLLEKFEWAENNQELVFNNSKDLFDWCCVNFTFEKVCERASNLIFEEIQKQQPRSRINKKNIKFDVVVAHYKENLNWISNLDFDLINKVYVYTKSEETLSFANPKIVHTYLPNIGRESHTYLQHTIDQYDDLKNKSDFIFFVQGSPHGMGYKNINSCILDILESELNFTCNFRKSNPNDFLNAGRCPFWAGATSSKNDYTVREWCDKFVKKDAEFDKVPIFWNACFGVSTSLITLSDKNRYQKIIEELNDINPECGHYCERLWYYIFNMDQSKQDYLPKNCYSFWGGLNAENNYGTMLFRADKTIGFYIHDNESFWEEKDNTIILYDKDKSPTSILNKINENEYSGSFLKDSKIKHKLIKIDENNNKL